MPKASDDATQVMLPGSIKGELSINNKFISDAIELIRSGAQVVLVPTRDEKSIQSLFIEIARLINEEVRRNNRPAADEMEVVVWDSIYGFWRAKDAEILSVPNAINMKSAMSALVSNDPKAFPIRNAIIIMMSAHDHLNGVLNTGERRVLAMGARNNMFLRMQKINKQEVHVRRPVFLIQPDNRIHQDISDCVNLLRYDLPGHDELGEVLKTISTTLPPERVNLNDQDRYEIAQSMKGLTISRSYDVLSLATVKNRGMSAGVLPIIQNLKADMIAMSNRALNFIPYETVIKRPGVIGFDNLMDYIGTRAQAYSIEALKHNLDFPKGVVLAGIPGTGKTEAAYNLAKILRLPMLRYNVGALYASAVGASEEMARDAHRIITRQDGSVVFIDEADKMFNSITDGKNDGGVGQRVFSEILTWIAEKNDRNLVVMALNRFDGIPDELFRKGRFDELFYIDLPNADQRRQIFELHMRDKNLDVSKYESGMDELVEATNNFVGAEIKQVIIDARAHQFDITNKQSAEPPVDLMILIAKRIAPFIQHEVGGEMKGFDLVKKRARPVFSSDRPFAVKKPNAKSAA